MHAILCASFECGTAWTIVIVISRLLKRYLKAKRTREPTYSRALRRIKGGFSKGGSREAQVRFSEGQEQWRRHSRAWQGIGPARNASALPAVLSAALAVKALI